MIPERLVGGGIPWLVPSPVAVPPGVEALLAALPAHQFHRLPDHGWWGKSWRWSSGYDPSKSQRP